MRPPRFSSSTSIPPLLLFFASVAGTRVSSWRMRAVARERNEVRDMVRCLYRIGNMNGFSAC